MKTAAVIAEYNPFHNGHQFHLERTRSLTGADYIVAVMSGDFVQRGQCAVTDKYARTRMALLGGADLVLELPVLFACGSAGDFAAGAVALVDGLGVADALCFGSECGDIAPLLRAASLLCAESPAFQAALQGRLKEGWSFPRARAAALRTVWPKDGSFPGEDFFSSPNNILGLEYCLCLTRRGSAVRPVTVRREGAAYGETALPGPDASAPTDRAQRFPSALALRRLLASAQGPGLLPPTQSSGILASAETTGGPTVPEGGSPAPMNPADGPAFAENPAASFTQFFSYVPAAQHGLWQEILAQDRLLFPADLTKELRLRLLQDAPEGYTRYADVTRELSDKLRKSCMQFSDWDDLCVRLKTKELTYSRISRALCHILLSVTAQELTDARSRGSVPYARILGFRREAAPLLSAIRANSAVPLLSKPADAKRLLSPEGFALLQKDVAASHLYESATAAKRRTVPIHEYTRQLVII